MARTELATDGLLDRDPAPSAASRWAWGVCWLMFASTVLNYMDRQTVSLASGPIKAEFGLSDTSFGWLLSAFYITYALCQVPAGYFVDRWDVRHTYAGAVAWWSLAGLVSAFSPSLGVLMVLRSMLGVGESFNWPCALRVTGTILPASDRSLGNGIFNSGAAVGAVLTPLVVTPLTLRFGWRTSFLVVGASGFAWVILWLIVVGGAHRDRFAGRPSKEALEGDLPSPPARLSAAARADFLGVAAVALLLACSALRFGLPAVWWGIAFLMIGTLVAARSIPLHELKEVDWARSLGEVVRRRRFWVLLLVSASINVCWHFLAGWLPTYLKEDRGMSFSASGLLTAVPFLAADVGNLGGGAFSRSLARRGLPAGRARLATMSACTLLITAGAWVGWVRSDAIVILLLALMAMGTAGFMANYFAFTQEVDPGHTGLVVGLLGGIGNLFAAGFLPFAGYVKDVSKSFSPIFVLIGLLPVVGLCALMLGWGSDRGDAPGSS